MQLAVPARVPNYRLPISRAWLTVGGMGYGRLIRVNKPGGKNANAVAYIVALRDVLEAMHLIQSRIAEPGEIVEDLGRVSDALILAMKLEHGEFTRA